MNPCPGKVWRAVSHDLEESSDVLCQPLPLCFIYTLHPSNSAALGKQQFKTELHGTVLSLQPSGYLQESSLQMASCREATSE